MAKEFNPAPKAAPAVSQNYIIDVCDNSETGCTDLGLSACWKLVHLIAELHAKNPSIIEQWLQLLI